MRPNKTTLQCPMCDFVSGSSSGYQRHVKSCAKRPSKEEMAKQVAKNVSLNAFSQQIGVSTSVLRKWLNEAGFTNYRAGQGGWRLRRPPREDFVAHLKAGKNEEEIAGIYGVRPRTIYAWRAEYNLLKNGDDIDDVINGAARAVKFTPFEWSGEVVAFLEEKMNNQPINHYWYMREYGPEGLRG